MIVVNDYFWTATCEYADVVFGVDSWIERQLPDIYAAVTNPFLQRWPPSPLPRLYDTRDDVQVWAGIARKLAELTGDRRFHDYWHFVHQGQVEVYIDRVFRAGNATNGYSFRELLESCRQGIPLYLMTRTSPRIVGWEQTNESKPWYNKTGRLEFYREEDEFIEYGENLPVVREPVDGTHHEPNVILARPHPAIRPKGPQSYGLDPNDLRVEVRQVRNVVRTPEELLKSEHPLRKEGYTHVLITPKYRHACHSTAGGSDLDVVYWGPFGDFTAMISASLGWGRATSTSTLRMPKRWGWRTAITCGVMVTPPTAPSWATKERQRTGRCSAGWCGSAITPASLQAWPAVGSTST